MRKDEAQKKEQEEKTRDAMPDALRAEADLKAALEHKEAKKRDQQRLEAQNEATDKHNREREAVMSAQIGMRQGKSSVIGQADTQAERDNMNGRDAS